MNKKVIVASIMFAIILGCSAISVYAYFTVVFTEKNNSSVSIGSTNTPVITSEGGQNLSLLVDIDSMEQKNIDTTKPILSEKSNEPLYIKLAAEDYNGGISCDYNIFYTPTSTYYATSQNIENKHKELVISIYKDDNKTKLVDEFSLNNVENKVSLLKSTIVAEPEDSKIENKYYIEIAYYNQFFSQDENSGKTFGGEISLDVDLASCKYWVQ